MTMLTARHRVGVATGAVAAGVAAMVALTSCAVSGVTADRLGDAVGPAFSRLYAFQQHELGRTVPRRPDGVATCRRNSSHSPRRGAGDDWVCIVNYPFADGHIQPITYDLHVEPNGCYTADGPTQVVGPQRQRDATGTDVTNPLFEFDGCIDVT